MTGFENQARPCCPTTISSTYTIKDLYAKILTIKCRRGEDPVQLATLVIDDGFLQLQCQSGLVRSSCHFQLLNGAGFGNDQLPFRALSIIYFETKGPELGQCHNLQRDSCLWHRP